MITKGNINQKNAGDQPLYLSIPKIDYFLVYFLLCFSGNNALGNVPYMDYLLSAFAVFLAILLIYYRKPILNQNLILICSIFGLILLIQCISFSFFPTITLFGFFVRLYIGFAVIVLVKKFLHVYVRVMIILAMVSLFFYGLQEAGYVLGNDVRFWFKPLGNIFTTSTQRIPFFIHTYLPMGINHRNSGMFWEPGAFAGYLTLALVFLAIIKNEIAKQDYKHYLIILSIALLTTLSTTGYLVYPLVLLLHYGWQAVSVKKTIGRRLLAAFIGLPLIVTVSIYSYKKFDFLQTKIEKQLQATEYREGRWYQGRLGSIVFDWEYIKKRPLTGWGIHSKTRFALHPWVEGSEGMGNGFSDFTAKFGIFGMLIFLIALYRGIIYCTKGNRAKSLQVLLIVMLVLQGEAFLGFPLFLGLMFLSGTLKQKRKVPLNPLRIHPVRDMHIRRGLEF